MLDKSFGIQSAGAHLFLIKIFIPWNQNFDGHEVVSVVGFYDEGEGFEFSNDTSCSSLISHAITAM